MLESIPVYVLGGGKYFLASLYGISNWKELKRNPDYASILGSFAYGNICATETWSSNGINKQRISKSDYDRVTTAA